MMQNSRTSAKASAGPSSLASSSSVPSLVRGGRTGAPRALYQQQQQQQARRGAEAVARATVRSAVAHSKLESSLVALESIKASAVNRYAQDTKSCIISIGLTSESGSADSPIRGAGERKRRRQTTPLFFLSPPIAFTIAGGGPNLARARRRVSEQ